MMANAQPAAAERWSEGRGLLMLWAAVGLGPIVWALRFSVVYVLAGTACAGWGLALMAVLSAAAVGLSLFGAWMGWTIWTDIGPAQTTAGGLVGSTRFLAVSAVVFGIAFAFVTAVEAIPLLMLEPCRT